jgi:hypothetical protein
MSRRAAMMYCLNRFRSWELQTAVLRAQKTFEERLAGDAVTTDRNERLFGGSSGNGRSQFKCF